MKAPQADCLTASMKENCCGPAGRSTLMVVVFPPSSEVAAPLALLAASGRSATCSTKLKMSSARPVACSLSGPAFDRLRRRHSCPPPTCNRVTRCEKCPLAKGCNPVCAQRASAAASSQAMVAGGSSASVLDASPCRSVSLRTRTGSSTWQPASIPACNFAGSIGEMPSPWLAERPTVHDSETGGGGIALSIAPPSLAAPTGAVFGSAADGATEAVGSTALLREGRLAGRRGGIGVGSATTASARAP